MTYNEKSQNPEEPFADTLKVDEDVWNAISGLQLAETALSTDTSAELEGILIPLPTYEEYFSKHGPAQGYAKRNIEEDSPSRIAAFNKLVANFNSDRERIIKERDLPGLTSYIDQFRKIIY